MPSAKSKPSKDYVNVHCIPLLMFFVDSSISQSIHIMNKSGDNRYTCFTPFLIPKSSTSVTPQITLALESNEYLYEPDVFLWYPIYGKSSPLCWSVYTIKCFLKDYEFGIHRRVPFMALFNYLHLYTNI